MIEIEIPEDILRFKTTLVGPLTARQAVCVVICALLNFGIHAFADMCGYNMGMGMTIRLGVVISMPVMAFGIIEPFGIPLEKYLTTMFLAYYLSPKDRLYETRITLSSDKKDSRKHRKHQKKYSAKTLKEHPEYIGYQ